jgi:hypothetical protein
MLRFATERTRAAKPEAPGAAWRHSSAAVRRITAPVVEPGSPPPVFTGMEKQLVPSDAIPCPLVGAWLDLDTCARVRPTSEDPAHPVQAALKENHGAEGWRAAQPGAQTLWVHFDHPQAIQQVHVCFETKERRTQEFVLLHSSDGGITYHDIVRQQFNFSPDSAPREEEDYFPRLNSVTDLKLMIVPDISGGEACATLQALRIA